MVPGPYNDQSEDRVQAREQWWTDNFRECFASDVLWGNAIRTIEYLTESRKFGESSCVLVVL